MISKTHDTDENPKTTFNSYGVENVCNNTAGYAHGHSHSSPSGFLEKVFTEKVEWNCRSILY